MDTTKTQRELINYNIFINDIMENKDIWIEWDLDNYGELTVKYIGTLKQIREYAKNE
jgi:hypothetical protein